MSDEQRNQSYLNLINHLLTCPKWEEVNILESNAELIDSDLIWTMKNVANQLRENGRLIEAKWLLFTSEQLLNQKIAKGAGFNEVVSKSDDALSLTHVPDYFDISDHNFLREVLQRVDQNPTPEYIYPLLKNNLSRLNYRYLGHLLETWSTHKFTEVDQQDAQDIAGTICNFGVLINQFENGNKESNQELAIIAYKIALTIFTFDKYPEKWADLQYNLGNSYQKRIKDNKSDNLEQSLIHYQKALIVYDNNSFTNEWAFTQINIASAYAKRFKDDRANNLEKSIESFQKALQVFTQYTQPYYWGIIQNNLSAAYQSRIQGTSSINLNYALVCCQNALQVFTIESYPYEWAEAQNNLGNIYQEQINGVQWSNLENALIAYHKASQVFTYEKFPYQWAEIQHNLALMYLNRKIDNKLNNLNQALNCCYQALRVYTPKNLIYDWADIQKILGSIYAQLTSNEESIEHAITAYQYALSIFTPQKFPHKYYQTATNLGHFYYSINNWTSAIETYHLAIEVVETLRLEALNPQRQQEIISNAISVYHSIVQAHLNLRQPKKALEYIERNKARNLVELMTQKNFKPQGVSQTIIEEYDHLRQQVVNEQIRLQHQSVNHNLMRADSLNPYVHDYSNLNEYQRKLYIFIEQKVTPIDPKFKLTQKVEPIYFEEIRALIDHETCLLQWYITSEKILAFIVSSDGNIQYWQSSATNLETITNTVNDYLSLYYSEKYKWIKQLANLFQIFAEALHIDDILALIPNTCKRLIIVPHRYLHILPIHCFPLKNGKSLYESFSQGVGYAPSCQLLKLVQSSQTQDFNRLFVINNPTRNPPKPLLGANLEVRKITQYFDPDKTIIIAESEASETTLENRRKELQASHCIHFSCHGNFNSNSPLDSALLLADPEGILGESANLTLAEVFEKLDLRQCRLVTFSACESGMIDPQIISDEYIGLPSGFLFAGSSCIISTLWTVDPLATALFMTKFYRNLHQMPALNRGSMAIILNKTQTWLKALSSQKLARIKNSAKFQQLLLEVFAKNKRDSRCLDNLDDFNDLLEAAVKREPYPFANPYYWTAFIATGI
ncbi:MAG: CHAT domain-containing protein [Pseudanabaena sp. ELA645]|jgi:CHAT domain-containing protein